MEIYFQILGRNSNEVGDNLEILAKELFARLGFGSFIRNAYKTGAEIDLKAKHRATGTPLLCECKAHNAPLDTRAIRLFYSEWEKERKADPRLFGVFISTSGYTGTAKQWHEELDANTKQNFVLVDAENLLSQLIDVNLTLSPQAISTILNNRYSIGNLQTYWLTFSTHGLAWFYQYTVDGKPLFFTIANGNGEAIPVWKCNEILGMCSIDMSKMRLFGIDLRQKIQIELLKVEGATVTMLSQETQESITDVKLALDILEEQGLVKKAKEEYWFIRDIVPFITIARHFLSTKEATIFLFSKYAQEMILSIPFSSYIDNRYNLDMSPKHQEMTARLMAISPSALLSAIFQDPSRYIQTRRDIERVISDPIEKNNWLESHSTSLLQELVIRAAHDLTGRDHNLSGYFSNLVRCTGSFATIG